MNQFRLRLYMKTTTASSSIFFHNPETKQEIKTRIVGGSVTSVSQVPYQISIELYGKHICGANIISANWALSAAHCFPDMFPSHAMKIRSGTSRATSYGRVHEINEVILHKNYYSKPDGTPVNDIAVISTKQPFLYSHLVKRIEMFEINENLPVGSMAVISGWGLITETKANDALKLHMARVPILMREECRQIYPNLPVGQICAGYRKGGIDACSGDSGGPLVVNRKLAGVVSWGIGCGRIGFPGVYSEVAFYRQWIKETTGV